MSEEKQAAPLEILLQIARDLTASLAAADRYERLLEGVRRLIPCDAACLLRVQDDTLVPVAAHGLSDEALVREYPRRENPRLDLILAADGPVRFPVDSPLPDPFDGLLASDPRALDHIHACLGCRLMEGDRVVGALTADALAPHAFDDLEPQWLEALGLLAGAALHTGRLIESIEELARHRHAVARELQRDSTSTHFLGQSVPTRRMLEEAALVAKSEYPALLIGETGVGKEIVAHQIHRNSARADEALIHVNCAALPESIAESELFGHVQGAFTGASQDRAGKFEIASGGTLFLDEIGELPPSVQPTLLRALQQGEIQRVGSDRSHRVDVRIIAATNRDLEGEIEAGRFRADLYHRLAVYPIRVPPLRERREDIPLLAAHFLDRSRRHLGLGAIRLSPDAREKLVAGRWPGNVRELENVLSRAVLRASGEGAARGPAEALIVEPDHLGRIDVEGDGAAPPPPSSTTRIEPQGDLKQEVQEFQRRRIEEAVDRNDGNWAAAARELGLHRSNLHRLATRLGLRGG